MTNQDQAQSIHAQVFEHVMTVYHLVVSYVKVRHALTNPYLSRIITREKKKISILETMDQPCKAISFRLRTFIWVFHLNGTY